MSTPLRSVLDEPRAPDAAGAGMAGLGAVVAVAVRGALEATLREDMPHPWLSWLVAVGALAHAAVAADAPARRGRGRLRRPRRRSTSGLLVADARRVGHVHR